MHPVSKAVSHMLLETCGTDTSAPDSTYTIALANYFVPHINPYNGHMPVLFCPAHRLTARLTACYTSTWAENLLQHWKLVPPVHRLKTRYVSARAEKFITLTHRLETCYTSTRAEN